MLRLLRTTTQSRSWLYSRPCLQRGIHFSRPLYSDLAPVPPSPEEVAHDQELEALQDEQEQLAEEMEKQSETDSSSSSSSNIPDAAPSDMSFSQFISDTAEEYKFATPQHWLGGQVPFPLNPSFKPPPPISNAQRDEMYRLYMEDPEKNNVRALSQRFHVSLTRVDAILRLKGMQSAWVKGNQLQTGFVRGMERLLGVPMFDPKTQTKSSEDEKTPLDALRENVHEADILEETEASDPARLRYQRMYWETLPEFGGRPIVPGSIERSVETAKYLAAKAARIKDAQYLPTIPDTETIKTPKDKHQISMKEGRPDIHFIDVGAKFVDIATETKRLARIQTRARSRAKKSAPKMSA